VTTAVSSLLNSGGIQTYSLTTDPADVTSTALGSPITVTINVAFSDISWLSPPRFLSNTSISASATVNSERP
jgi:hypothetical protein